MSRASRSGLLLLLLAAGCSTSGGVETVVREFSFPWDAKPAPQTEFRARTDSDRLYFTFEVEDADVIVAENWDGESTLDGEDRVELFVAKDAELADYWCIEIDPQGRVHDYHARHYRQFDSGWNCPDLRTQGERTPTGYVVRASIPLAVLGGLLGQSVRRGSEVRVGLFRAEFYGSQAATHGAANDNWISWIRPTSAQPDFHTPGAFAAWRLP